MPSASTTCPSSTLDDLASDIAGVKSSFISPILAVPTDATTEATAPLMKTLEAPGTYSSFNRLIDAAAASASPVIASMSPGWIRCSARAESATAIPLYEKVVSFAIATCWPATTSEA
jgi:hypothetical protein